MDIEECIDYTSQVLNVDEARAELDKLHQRITELDLSVENGTAIMRENNELLALVSELKSQSQEAFENGWNKALEVAAVKVDTYPTHMLKIKEAALASVIDRDIDIGAELRAMKTAPGNGAPPASDGKCPECGFAHAPGGNTCCSR